MGSAKLMFIFATLRRDRYDRRTTGTMANNECKEKKKKND
jgi:hypothetical protein